MNQSQFADFLGISRQSIGFYEAGGRAPDANTIKLICEKCNVSADWLLGLPGEKTNSRAEKIIGRAVGLSPQTARWLNREVEGLFSAKSTLERYASNSISAFLNHATDRTPNQLREIEAYVHKAIIHDAYDTQERAQRLQEFLDSEDADAMTMWRFFLTQLGADIEAVGDKRDREIDSAIRMIRDLITKYVSMRGKELRELLAETEGEKR